MLKFTVRREKNSQEDDIFDACMLRGETKAQLAKIRPEFQTVNM